MPEFILDHGCVEGARDYAALDAFAQGYVEAMFFTSTGSADDEELEDATTSDLSADAWAEIEADCAKFQKIADALLAEAYARDDYSPEQAGRDFWFTRNGHGVGFWDQKQLEAEGLGRKLSDLCGWRTEFKGCSLYLGDDGELYLS
jgi:hypothetical protein